jgi:hypothetical protein
MHSETAVRRRRTEAAAVEGDYGRVLPQVNPGVVGLAGLEPAASSLSGFCAWVCFRRIAPTTCANDVPLETAPNRSVPMDRGPNVDQTLARGPGSRP